MAQKEDSGRSTYKIGIEETQSDTNEDEEVEWILAAIFTRCTKKRSP